MKGFQYSAEEVYNLMITSTNIPVSEGGWTPLLVDSGVQALPNVWAPGPTTHERLDSLFGLPLDPLRPLPANVRTPSHLYSGQSIMTLADYISAKATISVSSA